jgi:hypothetical protein
MAELPADAAVVQALEDYLRSEVKLPPNPILRQYAQRLVSEGCASVADLQTLSSSQLEQDYGFRKFDAGKTARYSEKAARSTAAWDMAQLHSLAPSRQLEVLQATADKWQPGRWRLDSVAGSGSSGVVVSARDNRLGRTALKFSCGDARLREREAALMQRVSHPHVCRLHEHASLDGGALFGMCLEYMGGGSLQQLMNAAPDGRIRQLEVARMAFHVLQALQHIHQQGAIHRDLKPANIMITEDDERGAHIFKLIDFGISVLSTSSAEGQSGSGGQGQTAASILHTDTTGLRKFVGTRHWMSPEQCRGQRITAATDLWSLGAVMFAALSGRMPFAHGVSDEFAVAQAIVNDVAPRLDSAIEVRITCHRDQN